MNDNDWTDGLVPIGSLCSYGHPLWLVTEGYALCHGEDFNTGRDGFFAWSLTPRESSLKAGWWLLAIQDRDGQLVDAWVSDSWPTKERALAFIQEDMDRHQTRPYDEARERARLMPV